MMEGLALRRALLTASHEILQTLFDLSDPYEARQVIAETSYPNTAPSLAKLDEYIKRYEEKKELELATKDLKDDASKNTYKPKKI